MTTSKKTPRQNWRSFEEARDYVRSLGLQNWDEWREWSKSDKRPKDIPATPARVYESEGWAGVGDWLGSGTIASFNRVYLPFAVAREFVGNLRLKSQTEWRTWAKTDKRPHNIPAAPATVYKSEGWISWGDWLGTGNRKGGFLDFEDARTFVHRLELKNKAEWSTWAKSDARPQDIPAGPSQTYKGKGWAGWGDWLGTGYVATRDRNFLSFAEARDFVRGLGLKDSRDWKSWCRTQAKPDNIPAHPNEAYECEGWIGWGDWLGTGAVPTYKRRYMSFEKARAFARSLGLKNQLDWQAWYKTNSLPVDIPADPQSHYSSKGWSGWGDWLGTGYIATRNREFLPFNEARAFVRNLHLIDINEWRAWRKSNARPSYIPANPAEVYQDKGWSGTGDWLGVFNQWNRNAILSFLRGIEPIIPNLQPNELFAIMRQNGMIASSSISSQSNANLIKSIRDLCSSPNPEADFETLVAEIEAQDAALDDDEIDVEAEPISEVVLVKEEETKQDLPTLRSLAALKAVDALVDAGITSDEETIEFLVANRVSGLWQATLNAELTFDLDMLRAETSGTYFDLIRSRFLTQYDGSQQLAIPAGYDFRVDGRIADPNLMQRLTAYRVLSERRLGNWSGVGAGKTLSAILASRVIDAHLTVVVAFNSTVQPWAKRITETYPDSKVYIKERGDVRVDRTKHTYLVLNFETFQQPDSAEMVRRLVEKHQIDFVVLDEIQSVKQRAPKVTSKRRQVVSGLLSAASEKNPDLCVLGMSATPVINNLYEARALLELVKGVEFSDLQTYSSIANASAMHEKLILYGIRYRPQYAQRIETTLHDVSGAAYLPRLRALKKGAILDLERVLLDAKLETIIGALQKGTLIYTHYLTGLITPLRRAIEKAGFTVGTFTGDDKSGLQPFIKGKVDVLIGSVPVGTGVDGLQYVCNRLIIVSLPWTSAEYEQLVGRLYRQGSVFDKVEVIIPQVTLAHNGDVWSWDKLRWHRIQYKKTLADAALDGVIPEGELSSPETMFKQAREALQAWITRVEQDDVFIIERVRLRVPLPTEDARRVQRRFGDLLSTMNARLNTAYSSTTHERLQQQPEEWYLYHTLYREARQAWAEIPYEKIASSLKRRPDWIIGDFGCGEAQLAALLPNIVHSFDHIAIHNRVTACDMTHTPLSAEVLDVAVFSLSLMGLNYADYLIEAQRTLRFGGLLKIAEPISRWADKRSELLSAIATAGFLIVGQVEESGQFFYIDALKMEK
jgi:hypothetical protein